MRPRAARSTIWSTDVAPVFMETSVPCGLRAVPFCLVSEPCNPWGGVGRSVVQKEVAHVQFLGSF